MERGAERGGERERRREIGERERGEREAGTKRNRHYFNSLDYMPLFRHTL